MPSTGEMIREKAPINLTLSITEADENFPDIQVSGTVKTCDLNSTCTTPKFCGLLFSSDQVAQLTGYIRSKDEINIVIEPGQKELFDGDDDPEPDED